MTFAKLNARLVLSLAIVLATFAVIGIACTSEPEPTATTGTTTNLHSCPRTDFNSCPGTHSLPPNPNRPTSEPRSH